MSRSARQGTRLLGALIFWLGCAPSTQEVAPNIVLFLADDQGWTGASVAMDDEHPDARSDFYRTPSLERLAREGMRFAQAYAASPVCSPTRASLQTGMSRARLRMTDVIMGALGRRTREERFAESRLLEPATLDRLPEQRTTLAEAIRSARPDYATAHFGKWHLGGDHAGQHGFEVYDAGRGSGPDAVDPQTFRHGIAARAVAFVREQAERGRPFFVQVSHYAVHKAYSPREETLRRWNSVRPAGRMHGNRKVAAMTADLDADLGLLLDALDELGIAGDTFVLYFSDNGGYTDWSTNAPLSGGKFSLREGGLRVPMVVRGPGVAAGSATRVPVIAWDFLPTILEIVAPEAAIPADVEGGSLVPLLRARGEGHVERPREELVWHFPHYHDFQRGSRPGSAIRSGRFKLLVDDDRGRSQLFDVEADISEAEDLFASRPEVARALQTRLDGYLSAIDAPRARPRSASQAAIGSTPSS